MAVTTISQNNVNIVDSANSDDFAGIGNVNIINPFYTSDLIKIGGENIINDGAAHKIGAIDLGSYNASMQVSKALTLGNVVSSHDATGNPSLTINVTGSASLTLSGAAGVTQDNTQANITGIYRGLTQIVLSPGATINSTSDNIIFGHLMIGSQSFTNTTDANMELAFNDDANIFELQPIGEVPDLV